MRTCLAGIVVPALAVALSCRLGPRPLAVVGDHEITREELDAVVLAQTGKRLAGVSPELAGALFEEMLAEAVLVTSSPVESDRDLPAVARSVRARELLVSLCPSPPEPSEPEVDGYIAAHPELLRQEERILVRQLILGDRAAAVSARDRLRAGADFDELSRRLSRAPNAAEGGRLGWLRRDDLPPKFEAALISVGPGGVSEPVESNSGWHLFQVVDRRESGSATDPELRAEVRRSLAAAAAEAMRTACLARLAATVGVEIDCRDAGFPCRNPFEGAS